MGWKKISANHLSNEELVFKRYKKFMQFYSKKPNQPIKISAKNLNIHFFKEDKQNGQQVDEKVHGLINNWNCNSKPQ